jgi:putative ABC transport system ATP-binding protein
VGGALIRLDGVTKTYDLGNLQVPALKEITLRIAEGEYVAIMGPSGSGKSTLMNILGCLDIPTTGRYELRGRDVGALDDDELSRTRNREIGFVFQTFNLLPRATAAQNVELPLIYSGMGASARRRRAAEALEVVGLSARAKHRPNELSGGEGQRVAIARALVTEPALILADEPTGNLDSRTGEGIMAAFDRISRSGRTLILVTHEEAIAAHARRILRLHDGCLVSDARTRQDPARPH